MPLGTSTPFLARRGKACVQGADPGSLYNLQRCEMAWAQQITCQLPAEVTMPGTAQTICLLWGIKISGIVKGNFQYPWNQTCSSRERFHGISFAGRGREWEVERIWCDSTVLTEKMKNNHSSQWRLVIPALHMGVRHLNAFADSVHDLELK